MKKLTKIKLINWHTFVNETIEIKNNALVTGQTGIGKSTLLDAVQYVLTAGDTKFNKAADEHSKRTVETYVRCKISSESKEYLRDGDVTSYIALEFKDEQKDRIDIIGACIEVSKGIKPSKIFFNISNKALSDDMFINNKLIKTLSEFKREEYVEYLSQVGETKKMLKAILGINDNRYFTLLSKALAFKPIDDISEFVYKFLLEEQNINLDSLRDNIDNVRELKNTIEEEENKIKFLEEIEEKHKNYIELDENSLFYTWAKNKIELDDLNQELKEINSKLNSYNSELNIENGNLNNIQENIKSLKESLDSFKKSKEGVNGYNIFNDLKTQIAQLNNEIKNLDNTFKNFNKYLQLELNIDKSFKIGKLKNFDINNYEEAAKKMIDYKNELDKLSRDFQLDLSEYEKRKNEAVEKRDKINSKLDKLYKNQMPYPANVIKLKNEINQKLKENYSNFVEVRPICEYVEIIDEDYRNAIEGYLNTQKFDLVVEPKYFDYAVKVYNDFKDNNDVYGIGIIDTKRLKESEVLENSLYTKIKAKGDFANAYIKRLLGSVICVDKVEDLKNHKISITKSCMFYKNNVVRKINPKNYDECYIGERAQQIQIDKCKEANRQINELLNIINEGINNNTIKIRMIEKSNINEMIRIFEQVKNYLNKTSIKKDKQKDLDLMESNGLLFDINSEIEKKEKKIDNEQELIEKVRQEISDLKYKINSKSNEKDNISEKISTLLQNKIEEGKDYTQKLNNIKGKELNKIELENENKKGKILSDIENLQKNYVQKYSFDEIPNFQNIDKFLKLLYNMRERELIKYKDDCRDLEKKCEISFKEDFISKISGYIENAQDNIRELNRNLKKHKFGSESYEFIFKPSKDNSFGKYYEIITSGRVYNSNNLFDEDLTEKERDSMDELYSLITSTSSDESVRSIIDNYTDYRNYMSYDIKVTNGDDYYYFSKASKEKSGGEIQTPCYVMIAASFDELRKNTIRDDSVGCLVLFDEAFNKMDDIRIDELMKFYNQLNIQLIIATPPDKISSIAPYVDTNLLVSKGNNRTFVTALTKEDFDEL